MAAGHLLVITILVPLLGAGLLYGLARLGRDAVRYGALATTLVTLALTCMIVIRYPADGIVGDGFGVTTLSWLGADSPLDIRVSVGLDGLGLWLFALSSVLMVPAVLVSWESIDRDEPLFYAMLMLLEAGCLGVFAARDIILFYVFFEFTLIPLFFLIGIWGSEQRQYAARLAATLQAAPMDSSHATIPGVRRCALGSRCLRAEARRGFPVPGQGRYCSVACQGRARVMVRQQPSAVMVEV